MKNKQSGAAGDNLCKAPGTQQGLNPILLWGETSKAKHQQQQRELRIYIYQEAA